MSYRAQLTEEQRNSLARLKLRNPQSKFEFSLMLTDNVAKFVQVLNARWGNPKQFTHIYIWPDGKVTKRR